MTTSEERYQKGLEVRRQLAGGGEFQSSAPAAFEIAPGFERLVTECLFGEVWTRPGLDMKTRSIATMAALTALGREPQLRGHIGYALNLGHSKETIAELFVHLALYVGVPATLNALRIAKEVFDERGI